VEAAVAEFFARLAYAVRLNNGVNTGGDRAIREHARNLGQSLRRGQWIRERCNIECGDLVFSEPLFVCCVTRRDKTASGLNNLSIPADYVWTVDQIEDSIDAVRVRSAQRSEHVGSLGVVDLFCALSIARWFRDDGERTAEQVADEYADFAPRIVGFVPDRPSPAQPAATGA
jgi:hypothetical protein